MSAGLRDLWGWPVLLGFVTAIGLLSALLGDGPADAVSWAALALPLAVAAWHLRGRRALTSQRRLTQTGRPPR